jgi:hypothetical protein
MVSVAHEGPGRQCFELTCYGPSAVVILWQAVSRGIGESANENRASFVKQKFQILEIVMDVERRGVWS